MASPLKLGLRDAAKRYKDERVKAAGLTNMADGLSHLGNMSKDEAFKEWAKDKGIIPVGESGIKRIKRTGVMETKDRQMILERAAAMREVDKMVQKCQEVFGDIIYEMEGEIFCPVCMESVSTSEGMAIPHKPECSLGALIEMAESYAYPHSMYHPRDQPVNPYQQGTASHQGWTANSGAGASSQYQKQQSQHTQAGQFASTQGQYGGGILSQDLYQQAQIEKNRQITQQVNSVSAQECIERYGSKTIGGPKAEPEWKTALKSALDLIPTSKRDGES